MRIVSLIARPDKRIVEGRGILPGIEVHVSEQDRISNRDTPLEKALEQLAKYT